MLAAGLCVSGALAQDGAQDGPQEVEPEAEIYGPATPELQNPASEKPPGIPEALAQIITTGLRSSPLLAASEAASESADADLRTAKWQRFPNISAEILTTTGGSAIADTDGIAANVALEQPVWTGGAISNQIDEARFDAQAAGDRVDITAQTLTLDIIQAYYDVARFDGRVRVLEQGLVDYAGLSASIERRVSQQVSPAVDLTLARSRMAQLEADLAASQEQRDISYLRLTELVGYDVAIPQIHASGPAAIPPPESLAVEEMKACSPALQERTNRLGAAQSSLDNAESQLFPRLLLQLSQNELTGARAALVLRAQTGNGLSKFSQIDRAEAGVAQAMAEYAQTDRQVRNLLRRQFAQYRAGLRGQEVSATAAEASQDLLASYQRQFVAGRRSWLDLSNAVTEVISSQLSANDNQTASAASAALILVLTCRWQPQG
nr:TolC family protein [Altererythrobacter lutimaris]